MTPQEKRLLDALFRKGAEKFENRESFTVSRQRKKLLACLSITVFFGKEFLGRYSLTFTFKNENSFFEKCLIFPGKNFERRSMKIFKKICEKSLEKEKLSCAN